MKFVTVYLFAEAVEDDHLNLTPNAGKPAERVRVPVRMFVNDLTTPEDAAKMLGEKLEKALNTVDLGDED